MDMLSEKIRLYPTPEQEKLLYLYANTARFTYNECLAHKIACYSRNKYSCKVQDLIAHIQDMKYSDRTWLQDIPEIVTKTAIKDLDKAYTMFYRRGYKGFPVFKKKDTTLPAFGTRADNFRQVDETHIKITGIKEPLRIKFHAKFPKIYNPRITNDGNYWYFSYSYEVLPASASKSSKVLGIDVGVKNFAVVTDGTTNVILESINKTKRVKRLERRKRHLQRKLSKKISKNKNGKKYVKTNNIEKLKKKVRGIDRKLRNIRDTYIHEITSKLVRTKPGVICIEDLNIAGMMKNRHLSKAIQDQCFDKFKQYLSYKCKLRGIRLVIVDRFYPSSKICSNCGEKKAKLSLSERTYVCEHCGTVIDRDINAALNLRNYALTHC